MAGGIANEIEAADDRRPWLLGREKLGGDPREPHIFERGHTRRQRAPGPLKGAREDRRQVAEVLVVCLAQRQGVEGEIGFTLHKMVRKQASKLRSTDEALVEA